MKAQKSINVELIIELYLNKGLENYGENCTQLEHALQCAQLALNEKQDSELVLAAFLHDIGHLLDHDIDAMGGHGSLYHEESGAKFLAKLGFSERITEVVSNHVKCKRYLAFINPEYLKRLSDASKHTLNFQCGPMTNNEAIEFEKDSYFLDSLIIRKYDDTGKLPETFASRELLEKIIEMMQLHLDDSITS